MSLITIARNSTPIAPDAAPIDAPRIRIDPQLGIVQDTSNAMDEDEWREALIQLLGTRSKHDIALDLDELAAGLAMKATSREFHAQANKYLHFLATMPPNNDLERALMRQMFLAAHHTVVALQKSQSTGFPAVSEKQSAIAVKFMRVHSQLAEALARLQHYGEQRVVVNYVQAEQAVVGDVHTGRQSGE